MTQDLAAIQSVPLGSLKRYLSATGWRRSVLPSGVDVFALGSPGDEVEIILPISAQARDLGGRIETALATISTIEGRDLPDVAAAIRAISYDLVLSRLPTSAIRHDTIALGTAEEFIRRMNRTLAATAHGELHRYPYFIRVDNTAQKYADDCRFGHTFRGSFGFTIESPVGPQSERLEIGNSAPVPPLERRAILRLARGLKMVERAIKNEDPEEIVRGYEFGLNANACDEIANLVTAPHVHEVNFKVVLSQEWGSTSDDGTALRSTIRNVDGAAVIRAAAKTLRTMNESKIRTVVGKVRTLHSMETPSDLLNISGTQDIIIEWYSSEFGKKNVHVSLGPEEYLQAVEAHKQGRSISVHGELEQGRQWRLENPREFRLLEK